MGLATLLSLGLGAATAVSQVAAASGTVWATPHDSYSSSVGVLGCRIDTDRVAYWPSSVDCTNLCVSLSYEGRSVKLLRVDQSQGAHDVSYDAWNYLYTGYGATEKPAAGGAVAMEYEDLHPSECADLIHTDGGKLPLSASNSMNFLASCLAQEGSWVSKNYVLYNILDSICSWGYDEECTLDWPAANQAKCANPLGTPVTLTSEPVYNIQYPSGQKVLASTGQVASSDAKNGSVSFGTRLTTPSVIFVGAVTAMLCQAILCLI
ncbi:uncharacterized protein JN550_004046 [Neoarthrinium moseri]|uniref:uncharacterized protein n=1 Tax=Neoarthrinium moseri TaxID=1658444 RepID=UPI001FDDE6DF|nr:uncharacterized protein JN550_004046 [Neoarthrinium moseri]KAI1872327.1 hypothetical protein JN550_004046 [Neoarthrinium moseri]